MHQPATSLDQLPAVHCLSMVLQTLATYPTAWQMRRLAVLARCNTHSHLLQVSGAQAPGPLPAAAACHHTRVDSRHRPPPVCCEHKLETGVAFPLHPLASQPVPRSMASQEAISILGLATSL